MKPLNLDIVIREDGGNANAADRAAKHVAKVGEAARGTTADFRNMGRAAEQAAADAAAAGRMAVEAIRNNQRLIPSPAHSITVPPPGMASPALTALNQGGSVAPITAALREQYELQQRQKESLEQQVRLRREETQILRLETQQIEQQRVMAHALQQLDALSAERSTARVAAERQSLLAMHARAAAKRVELERDAALLKAQQEYRANLARIAEERARNNQREIRWRVDERQFRLAEAAERIRHEQNVTRINAQAAQARMTALRAEQQLRRSINSMAASGVASVRSMIAEVARLTAGVVGFVSVAMLARSTIQGAFRLTGSGLTVVSDIEQAKLSIASLVTASTEMRDVHGRLLSLQEEYNQNLVTAERLYGKIQVASLKTMAETPQLLDAFQQAIGPATRAMQGLFDEGRIVRFTQMVAQSAVAARVPMHQLGQEIRGVIEGDISPDSRLSQLLFSDIPRKNVKKTIEEWKEQGRYFQEMERRMGAFAISGDRMSNTYAGAMSNLREAWTMALGKAFLNVSGDATTSINGLRDAIVQIDETTGEAKFNETLVSGLRAVGSMAVDVMSKFTAMAVKIDEYALRWRAFKMIASTDPAVEEEVKGLVGGDWTGRATYDDLDRLVAALSARQAQASATDRQRLIARGQYLLDHGIPGVTKQTDVRELRTSNQIGPSNLVTARITSQPSITIPVKTIAKLDDKEFRTQLAKFEAEHPKELPGLFVEIAKAAKDGKVTLEEFNAAKVRALSGGVTITTPAGGGLEDKITSADRKAQSLRNEMEELRRETDAFIEQQRRLSEDSGITARIEQLSSGPETQQAFNVIARIYEEERHQIIQLKRELSDFDRERADRLAGVQRKIAEKFVAEGVDPKIAMARALNTPEYQTALDEYAKRRVKLEESIGKRTVDVQSGTQRTIADEYRDTWQQLYDHRHQLELGLTEDTIAGINRIYETYSETLSAVSTFGQSAISGIFSGQGVTDALEGFGQQMQNVLAKSVVGFLSKQLGNLQIRAMGGDPKRGDTYDPNTGELINIDGERFPVNMRKGYRSAYAGLQVASGLYGLYQNGQAGVSPKANMASGAMQGAMVGNMIVPVYGAIVGAFVGAAAGALTAESKAGYTVTVANGQISITGNNKAKQSTIDSAIRDINRIIRDNASSVLSLFDAFPRAIAQTMEMLDASAVFPAGVIGAGDPKKGQNFLGRFFSSFSPLFNAVYNKIHAAKGMLSGDDLKNFIEVEVPKMLFDAYEPMLRGGMDAMGMTSARIEAVMASAKLRDPKESFQFITDYVEAFATLTERIDFSKMSAADRIGFALKEANKTTPDRMGDIDSDIAYLAKGFADLPLDMQLRRVQEINAKLEERYQMELQFIAEIDQVRRSVSESIEQQIYSINLGEATDRSSALSLVQARRADVAGRLAQAKTPAEVLALAQEYSGLTQQIYEFARMARDEFKTLIDGFGELDKQKARDADARLDPVTRMGKINASLLQLADGFESLTSDDQLSKGREILALMNEKYQLEKQWLEEIAAAQKSITQSIADQIFDIQQSQRKPQEQVDAINQQQRDLWDQLGRATSAQEVNDIVARMQRNTGLLYQMQGQTPAAAALMIQGLQAIADAATRRLDAIAGAITGTPEGFDSRIAAVTTTIETSFGQLSTAATTAATDLAALGTNVTARLDALFAQVTALDSALLAQLQPVFDAFSGHVTAAGTELGDLGSESGPVRKFRDRIIEATDALGNVRFRNAAVDGTTANSTATERATYGIGNNSASGRGVVVDFRPNLDVRIEGTAAQFVGSIRAMWRDDMEEMLRVYGEDGPHSIAYGGSGL